MRKLPLRGVAIDGDKLRAARLRAGLSQLELAPLADVDPTYICKLERGHRTRVSHDVHRQLSRALRVAQRTLLADPPEPAEGAAA